MTALLIDFGSTYTKLRAVELDPPRIIASGQGPSTITTDVTVGMDLALADLEKSLDRLPNFTHRLACSSAAGGLRMVTIGLVRELTAEAARQAALGAGAKLVGTFAQRLTRDDLKRVVNLAPDILLLAGGTDGGNSEVILQNAAALATSPLNCPIVVAGNRAVADDIQARLTKAGKPVLVAENVMPEFGELNTEPARAAIRKVFIERIVHAKGIDRAASRFDAVLMPTPAAVMEGAHLLAKGCYGLDGLGPLVLVDIGGATTDVHSIASGEPTESGVIVQGLPEPYVKRTVEGDLGMRHNAWSIVDAAGLESIAAEAGVTREHVTDLAEQFMQDVGYLPQSKEEQAIDLALARAAVRLAVKRHAGTIETIYTVTGPVTVQRGKDLRGTGMVIGTGGPLVHAPNAALILRGTLADPTEPLSLRPRRPRLMLDKGYLLYAVGLLSTVDRAAAFTLGRRYLQDITEDRIDGRSSAAS
ncbi:MAG: methylaspartate mutase accessory protein GlmL [Acidiferrobacterales bacterium]